MRIKIELDLQNILIPRAYQSKLQGIIYQMLDASESTQRVHDEGTVIDNRPFRLFVFSDLMGQKEIMETQDAIRFSKTATFEVAAHEDATLFQIIAYLQNHSKLLFGHQLVDVLGFELIQPSYPKHQAKVAFHTISPVTVYRTENKKTIYIKPDQEEYVGSLIQNLYRKHQAVHGEQPFVTPKITMMHHEPVSRRYRTQFIEANHLNFVCEDLDVSTFRLMMDCGIGSKNSIGFGMIRLEK